MTRVLTIFAGVVLRHLALRAYITGLIAVILITSVAQEPIRSLAGDREVELPRSADMVGARVAPSARLRQMSFDEKVGQLLMLGFPGSDAALAQPAISELKAGGIVLVANASTADSAYRLTSALQAQAAENNVESLLIAVDHEGGRVQRIRTGVTSFGANWDLGQVLPMEVAIAAACSRGATHGRELASVGINMNLAPVLDVWDNPQNEVISVRSYSSDPAVVAVLGAAYIEALQREGVLAVGKHFPGHGGTIEDSHLTLPIDSSSRARLEDVQLAPFRYAMRAHVGGIMVAHVAYPSLVPIPGRPASLSPAVVTGLLRHQLGYSGLVLTDELARMRAISDFYDIEDAATQAILAGADMVLVTGDVDLQRRVAQAIKDAVGRRISEERLNASVERVLRAKQQVGLFGSDGVASSSIGARQC